MNRKKRINDKLKNRLKADLSMQSLNLDTLKTVKRTNWTAMEYIAFTKELHKMISLRGSNLKVSPLSQVELAPAASETLIIVFLSDKLSYLSL